MMILQPALIEQDQMQHCQKQTPVCVSPRKGSCWVLAPAQPQTDGLRVTTFCTGEWDKLLLLGAPTWLQHLCPLLVSSPHLTAAGQHPPLAAAELLELPKRDLPWPVQTCGCRHQQQSGSLLSRGWRMSRGGAQGWGRSSGSLTLGSTTRSWPLSHGHGRLHTPALGSGSRKQTGRAG